MKKQVLIACFIIKLLVLGICVTGIPAYAQQTVTVILNGQELVTDVPAQIINDRAMVPFRSLFEELGAIVSWDEDTGQITGSKDGTTIVMTINSPLAYVNGTETVLDVPPAIVNDRTLVPTRFVSESLGAEVIYVEDENTVYILTADAPSSPDESDEAGASVIAHLAGGQTIDPVYQTIPDAQITELPRNYYKISSESASQTELENALESMGIFDWVNTPQEIRLINPVEKIKVGPDLIVPNISELQDGLVNDPGYSSEWALAWTDANQAWEHASQARPIIVAVVDTGVDYTHPDLSGRVLTEKGYDFVNNDGDPMDDNGHGTHCAGIIAAKTNNNQGTAGIAGEMNIAILPVKVMDSQGSGRSVDIASGIIFAVDNGADIINLSLGARGDCPEISAAVEYAVSNGVLVVAAAGNDSANADNYTPAKDPGVFTVAAINPLNTKAQFSNFGSCVDIAAPGVKILSTVPGGGYEAWSGTSMAAPVVSGIAAVLMACDSTMTANDAIALINSTATDIGETGYDERTGHGLINALKAIEE